MRNGGEDSERFTAGRSIEEPEEDLLKADERVRGDREEASSSRLAGARSVRVASGSSGPKSRAKRPSAKLDGRKTLVSALSPDSLSAPEIPVRLAGTKPPPAVTLTPEKAPEEREAAKGAPAKKAAPKKAKSRSAGPRSKRAPRSLAPPQPPSRKDAPAETGRAPISFDPKTTLVDHPGQKQAIHAVRASVPPSAHSVKSGKSVKKEREDEISIPPSSDLDEHDERFFAEGEILSRPPPPEAYHAVKIVAESEARAPRSVVPPERRKKLTNYVKMAVGFSAVLCLAALTRAGFSHVGHPMSEGSAAAAQVVSVPAPEPIAPSIAPAPAAPPVAEAAEEVAPPAAEPAPPAKSAHDEKEDARKALEHGKLKDSVEAGERSVALDPTDAEAWLILGSADQELGHGKSARDAFVRCTKEAKTGPVRECGLMLR